MLGCYDGWTVFGGTPKRTGRKGEAIGLVLREGAVGARHAALAAVLAVAAAYPQRVEL